MIRSLRVLLFLGIFFVCGALWWFPWWCWYWVFCVGAGFCGGVCGAFWWWLCFLWVFKYLDGVACFKNWVICSLWLCGVVCVFKVMIFLGVYMCLTALNYRREARCGYTDFGRFGGYFGGILQRFGTKFVSATARVFRFWFFWRWFFDFSV